MFSVAGGFKIYGGMTANVSLGGFPGIILRCNFNLRYYRSGIWTPYFKCGLGYTKIFRSNKAMNYLWDIHFNIGLNKTLNPNFDISADIGLLYAPYTFNPMLEEEFPDVLPIVPMLGFETRYKY